MYWSFRNLHQIYEAMIIILRLQRIHMKSDENFKQTKKIILYMQSDWNKIHFDNISILNLRYLTLCCKCRWIINFVHWPISSWFRWGSDNSGSDCPSIFLSNLWIIKTSQYSVNRSSPYHKSGELEWNQLWTMVLVGPTLRYGSDWVRKVLRHCLQWNDLRHNTYVPAHIFNFKRLNYCRMDGYIQPKIVTNH